VQFLKSRESKDSKALKYVDPDKYIQHNLHAEDGLPVVRKDGAWCFCRHVLAPLLRSLSPQPAVDSGKFPSYR
jgi:hypothetical protein